MPPRKRKAAATSKPPKTPAKRGRKAKKVEDEIEDEDDVEEAEEGPSTARDSMAKLRTVSGGKKGSARVDDRCHLSSFGEVVDDYDCMLNQTNIGHNNNKFYIIQVIRGGSTFYTWNRWGRVGESGQNSLKDHPSEDKAVADFKKKFKDKTRNNWDDRDEFVAKPGKYTLIEMETDDVGDEDEMNAKLAKLDEADGPPKKMAPCTLDKATQSLVKLIFDHDMFKEAMASMEIDIKKMPLGKLSKSQIAKGFEVLEEIEEVVNKKKKGNLTELTSRFFTMIPHSFGRQRPPIIADQESVRQKMDMLMVLADIEIAQAMQEEDKKKTKVKNEASEVPHHLDQQYNMLHCDVKTVDKKSESFKVIEQYMKATMGCRNLRIVDAWEVNRDTEGDRFKQHNKIKNRKLLWHGTNVAVVAAILKGGLRIMPHSGGRVGCGIYFASENCKSAGYVRQAAGGIGMMFLNEVALGKEKHITVDDSSLTRAPNGYDSIVAKGRQEPDPKSDTTIELDGREVVVPQGKPIQQNKFNQSNFSQSEYLVYKESQNCMRYMLKIKF